MYKAFCLLLLVILPGITFSQDIINYVMVGDQGVTKDPKEAKFIVLVKRYSDTLYQRLEYHFTGPLIRVITYRDAAMTVKDGDYRTFDERGFVATEGPYHENKKEGDWYQVDSNLQKVTQMRYRGDTLLFTWNADSIKQHDYLDSLSYAAAHPEDTAKKLEKEASFEGGDRGWSAYVSKQISKKYPERATSLGASGTVLVQFIIDTSGHVMWTEIKRSVELSLDETLLNTVRNCPPWTPASQNGRHVKAFRRQKITFQLPE